MWPLEGSCHIGPQAVDFIGQQWSMLPLSSNLAASVTRGSLSLRIYICIEGTSHALWFVRVQHQPCEGSPRPAALLGDKGPGNMPLAESLLG